MRTWTRARWPIRCGYCGEPIPRDGLVLELRIGTVVKYRCAACLGHPAPPDLPDAIELTTPAPVLRFSRLLPLDWRKRQSGEED
jgi:hypothetical protein